MRILSWVGGAATAWALTCAVVAGASEQAITPDGCNTETAWRIELGAASLEVQPDGSIIPRVADGVHMNAAGTPDLPYRVQLLPVSRDCVATIAIDRLVSHETNGISVAVRSGYQLGEDENGNPRVVPAESERSVVYSRDAWWPEEPLEVSYFIQGRQRWARLVYHPFQYNPVRGMLRYNDLIDARLIWRETHANESEESN